MYFSLNLDSANIVVTVGFLVFGFLATYFFIEPYEYLTQNITSRKTRYVIISLILISIYALFFSTFEFDYLKSRGMEEQSLFNSVYNSNLISYNMIILIFAISIIAFYIYGLIRNIRNNLKTNWYEYVSVRKKYNKIERIYNRILLDVLNSTEKYRDWKDKFVKLAKGFFYKTYVKFTSFLDKPLNLLSFMINTFLSKDLILFVPFLIPGLSQSRLLPVEYKDYYVVYFILFIVIFRYFYLLWKSKVDYAVKYELVDVFDSYDSFINTEVYKDVRLKHLANSDKHSIFSSMDPNLKKDEAIYYLIHRDSLSVEVVKSCHRWYYEKEENINDIERMNKKIEEWKVFFEMTLKEIKEVNKNE